MIKGLSPEVEAAHLEELREQFEKGRGSALISAMRWCANQQLVMPEWVVKAFSRATNDWYNYRAKTLDEAFGVQLPKGTHIAALRKKRDLKHRVHAEIMALRTKGRPINKTLFREVGSHYGIGATLCEEYYRSAAAASALPKSARMLLEPFLAPETRREYATRKITKFRESRSKK